MGRDGGVGTTLDAIVTSDGRQYCHRRQSGGGQGGTGQSVWGIIRQTRGTSVLTGAQQAGVPEGLITLLIGFCGAVLAKMAEQKTKTGTVAQ